jgi:hypothetical protein
MISREAVMLRMEPFVSYDAVSHRKEYVCLYIYHPLVVIDHRIRPGRLTSVKTRGWHRSWKQKMNRHSWLKGEQTETPA